MVTPWWWAGRLRPSSSPSSLHSASAMVPHWSAQRAGGDETLIQPHALPRSPRTDQALPERCRRDWRISLMASLRSVGSRFAVAALVVIGVAPISLSWYHHRSGTHYECQGDPLHRP